MKIISSIVPYLPKKLIQSFAKKYLAGMSIPEALLQSNVINATGMKTTLSFLGEHNSYAEAHKAFKEYQTLVPLVNHEDSGLSIKLSQLGLETDQDQCIEYMKKLLVFKKFIRIDMEGSDLTQQTLEIYKKLKKDHDNVGIVVQSYLKRTIKDIEELPPESNIRICKGIYNEPSHIAYKKTKRY